jgi:hypothetical protein
MFFRTPPPIPFDPRALDEPLPSRIFTHMMREATKGCPHARSRLAVDLPASLCWAAILAPLDPKRSSELAERAEAAAALLASKGDALLLDDASVPLAVLSAKVIGGEEGF